MCCCYSGPQRHSVCCYHSILVISHNHHELNFPLLAATFFWARRSCMLAPRGVRFQLWFKIKFPCLIYGKNSAHLLPRSAATVFLWPSFELLSVLHSADAEPTLQRLFSSAVFESRFWKQNRLTCLLHARFLHITASIFFQQGVDNKHRCVVCCSYWPSLLGSSWMLTRPSRKRDAHRETALRSTTLSPQTSCKALWISFGVFPHKVSILMYDHWSLCEIWLHSVSSSISRLRFAEQGPCSLRIRTHCSLLKCGSQLSWKSEGLHHPTGHASAVCRTFEMYYVYNI